MARVRAWLVVWALGAAVWAQEKAPPPPQEPPEEDETLNVKKEYAFNPLQAEKELKIGDFYFKRGSFRAAAGRFREATRWNPNLAEAYLRLGEAQEKLKDPKGARESYAKFIKLAPEDKRTPEVRKKLEAAP